MPIAKDSQAVNAKGGTELMKEQLVKRIDPALLNEFQIFVSRVEEDYNKTKLRIFWAHDLPGDPASEHLRDGGWNNYHRLVFVSNWQMQAYIGHYNIPWSKCIVLQNAIEPFTQTERAGCSKGDGRIRLAYWATPHRGLNILLPVFDRLVEKHKDLIHLDVFSSFNLYGWGHRDAPYKTMFDFCEQHPNITYHGTVDNQTLRDHLMQTDIMAYPSTWAETSCICLMEAMSAGMLCVHPNFAALPETAANWTNMYQWNENVNQHASDFYNVLDFSIETVNDEATLNRRDSQRVYANLFYGWDLRALHWKGLLTSMLDMPRDMPDDMFIYDG